MDLCPEAMEFGALVRTKIAARGGVDVLRRCVDDPSLRADVGAMLGELGVWDIDVRTGALELEVAAEVCRAAGHYGLPYPVYERLGASHAQLTTLVARGGERIASHTDLGLEWNAFDLDGRRYTPDRAADHPLMATELAPFSADIEVQLTDNRSPQDAATVLTLQSWWLLGLLQNAVEDTVRYTREREQFGQRLAAFQSVAFQLSDMVLEVRAAAELGKYAVWTLAQGDVPEDALVEALGLRLALQRAATIVLRGAHQLHGAMGFTDEVDISWLSRASQVVRRLPEDSHRTTEAFRDATERLGYSELGRAVRAQ